MPGDRHDAKEWYPFVRPIVENLALAPRACYRFTRRRGDCPRSGGRGGLIGAADRRTTVADISVERKPRSRLPLLLLILVIVVLAAAAWWYYNSHHAAANQPAPAAANG